MEKTKNRQRATEVLASILKIGRFCSKAVGADVTNVTYRMNALTALVLFCCFVFLASTLGTIYLNYNGDFSVVLESISMLGSLCQGVVKLLQGINRTKDLSLLRIKLEALYAEYEQIGARYEEALLKNCEQLGNLIKSIALVFIIIFFSMVTVGFGVPFITGERFLLLSFFIPGLDIETDTGYYLTMLVQSYFLLCGAFGLFAGDFFILIFFTQTFLYVDIFKLKIEELNQFSEEHNKNGVDAKLRDIIQWHQYYTIYLDHVNDIFNPIVTTQVLTSTISVMCTLFIILTSKWPIAYLYLIMACLAMYLYCILGTKIEICNDNVCNAIFDINMYNLKPVQSKMTINMLVRAQNPSSIQVAGVFPLTVNTALKISKTIYSCLMMMIQFLSK